MKNDFIRQILLILEQITHLIVLFTLFLQEMRWAQRYTRRVGYNDVKSN